MAPIGGGPPVGSWAGASGTGNSLNIVGDHIYGNNNASVADGATATFIDHTNGAYYAVIEIAGGRNMKSTAEISTIVELDGQECYDAKLDDGTTASLTMPFGAPFKMLIPPYSHFQLKFKADNDAAVIGITVVGRIYA